MTNRDWASVIWLGVLVLVTLSWRPLRTAVRGALRLLLSAQILLPVLLLGAYSMGGIELGRRLHLWGDAQTKDAVVWFFGTAVVLLFKIKDALTDRHYFRRVALAAVGVTVWIEAYLNISSFNLWIEVFIQPVIALLVMTSIVSAAPALAPAKRLIDLALSLVAVIFTAHVALYLIRDWSRFSPSDTARSTVLPVLMTLCVIPFVFVLALYAAYQMAYVMSGLATTRRSRKWRTQVAIASTLGLRPRDVFALRGYWLNQAVNASTLTEARTAVRHWRKDRATRERKDLQ